MFMGYLQLQFCLYHAVLHISLLRHPCNLQLAMPMLWCGWFTPTCSFIIRIAVVPKSLGSVYQRSIDNVSLSTTNAFTDYEVHY